MSSFVESCGNRSNVRKDIYEESAKAKCCGNKSNVRKDIYEEPAKAKCRLEKAKIELKVHKIRTSVEKLLKQAPDHPAALETLKDLIHVNSLAKKVVKLVFLNVIKEKKTPPKSTPLHYAARLKLIKIVAKIRLIYPKSMEEKDEFNKKPMEYLNDYEKQRVDAESYRLDKLLHKSSVTIISENMQRYRERDNLSFLQKLYEIPEIRPLMDLAKLFCIPGITNLFKLSSETLKITYDTSSNTIENMYKSSAYALYLVRSNGCTIYLGLKDLSLGKANFIHELTHLVAHELFKNYAMPYEKDNQEKKDFFKQIRNELKKVKKSLPFTLKQVFDYEDPLEGGVHDRELIARVPQMIVEDSNGKDTLKKVAPRLLDYFENEFLNLVRMHTEKIEKRALNDLPKDLFSGAN